MLKQIEGLVDRSLSEEFPEQKFDRAKNYLIRNVIIEYIKAFIKHEMSNLKNKKELNIRIRELEKFFMLKKEIMVNGTVKEVNFIGGIDRIDEHNNELRIIDYKTGAVQASELRLKSWEQIRDDDKSKLRQLLFYSWLYLGNYKNTQEISSGIYSFKKLSSGYLEAALPEKAAINFVSLKEFEEMLYELVGELYDDTLTFTQTSDFKACTYCTYKSICKRN